MITKAIGIKSAELIEDPTGNPGSQLLRLVTKNGGEVQINLTVSEIRQLAQVLAATSVPAPQPFKKPERPVTDATGFNLPAHGCHLGKTSLPRYSS